MSGRGSDCFEGSGADLLESGKFKNVQALVKAFAKGTVEARDPDRAFPVIPISRLKKIGPRYKKLNTILIIEEKCSLKSMHLSDDKTYKWLPQEFHDELRKIHLNPASLTSEYHQIFQINIPDIFFDYNKLIKTSITLNTEFDFVCKEDDIIKTKKSGCKQEIIKLKLMEMTPESIKWEFVSGSNQKHWKYYRAFEQSFFSDISMQFNKACNCMQLMPNEKRRLMGELRFHLSALPTITALPSWKLMAILQINSRIKLSDIEKYFIFGEGDLHDSLLKSFNEYFSLQGEVLKMVDEKIARFLQEKEPKTLNNLIMNSVNSESMATSRALIEQYTQHWPTIPKFNVVKDDAIKISASGTDVYNANATKAEIGYTYPVRGLLESELRSHLLASITEKLDFLYEYMSKEYVYENDRSREGDIFLPFECDLNRYTKKYFFPFSKDCEQEAERNFETLLKSLVYKKICTDNLLNADKPRLLTVVDLDNYENLAELRTFCQSLLRIYSKHILYSELREKACDSITATRIVHIHKQKNKGPKSLKKDDDPKNFGYPENTLRSVAFRLETEYVKKIPHSSRNIIMILGDYTPS